VRHPLLLLYDAAHFDTWLPPRAAGPHNMEARGTGTQGNPADRGAGYSPCCILAVGGQVPVSTLSLFETCPPATLAPIKRVSLSAKSIFREPWLSNSAGLLVSVGVCLRLLVVVESIVSLLLFLSFVSHTPGSVAKLIMGNSASLGEVDPKWNPCFSTPLETVTLKV
jgi:hypothetical protein